MQLTSCPTIQKEVQRQFPVSFCSLPRQEIRVSAFAKTNIEKARSFLRPEVFFPSDVNSAPLSVALVSYITVFRYFKSYCDTAPLPECLWENYQEKANEKKVSI